MKEQMREAFEAWVATTNGNYDYFDCYAQGYQAALSAVPANHVGDSNEMVKEPYGWHIKGMENAGMRYFFTKEKLDADYWQGHGMTIVPVYLQAQQPVKQERWLPIETAPKGKKIIVKYKNAYGNERTVFAKYIEKFTEESTCDTECETDYSEDDDTFYLKEGWVELIDNWEEFSSVYFDSANVPTGWMPAPPVEA